MEFTACKNKKYKNAANIRLLPGNYEPPGIYAPFSTGAAAEWFLALPGKKILKDGFGITVLRCRNPLPCPMRRSCPGAPCA